MDDPDPDPDPVAPFPVAAGVDEAGGGERMAVEEEELVGVALPELAVAVRFVPPGEVTPLLGAFPARVVLVRERPRGCLRPGMGMQMT